MGQTRITHPAAATALAGLVFALSGCVPVPLGSYYKPIASEGNPRYSGNQCHGATGAPVSMTLDLADGVELELATKPGNGAAPDKSLDMVIALTVPAGVRVKWTEPVLRIRSNDGPLRTLSPEWHVSGTKRVPDSGTVDWGALTPVPALFKPGKPTPRGFSARLNASFSWADFRPTQLVVELPGYRLAGGGENRSAPSSIGPQAFGLKAMGEDSNSRRTTIHYRTDKLVQDYADALRQCASQPSGKASFSCPETASMKTETFSLPHGPLDVSGRWWVYAPERNDPLRGTLEFAFREPLNLSWQDGQIRVKAQDGASPEQVRAIRLGDFTANSRFEAPLTSEIQGVGVGNQMPGTKATLSVDLGKDRPSRYSVDLPTILINGKPVSPKPIDLERRHFDVGLSPFNC